MPVPDDVPAALAPSPAEGLPRYVPRAWAERLLGTPPRRRMARLAGTALIFSVFTTGVDVVLPLWVTHDLGLSPADWSMLRSLRFVGVLVGVMLLGALSDRFGQRRLTVLAMLGAAGAVAAFGWAGRAAVWVTMPLFGALVSTAFVNLNTLTQFISDRRQGLANTIYRGVGALSGVFAPALVTALAAWWHGYLPAFLLFIACLLASALLLRRYPEPTHVAPLGPIGAELRGLLRGYLESLRQRELLRFVLLSATSTGLLASVTTFAAIRFTVDLGQSARYFGWITSVAGLGTLLAMLAGGFFLDRVSLRGIHVAVGLAAALCAVAMGASDSVLASSVAYVAFLPLWSFQVGPSSMWVSRAAAPGRRTSAFAVSKLFMALENAAAIAAMGALVPLLGMQKLLLISGGLSAVCAMGFWLLPEPAKPG